MNLIEKRLAKPLFELPGVKCNVLNLVVLLTVCLFAVPVTGQADDSMTVITTPEQTDAIDIGTGPLPGAKVQEAWHSQYGSRFARNVTLA